MDSPLQKTKNLDEQVLDSQSRLLRSTASGKSSDEKVKAKINGQGQIEKLELADDYGLSSKKKVELEENIIAAVNNALQKQQRRVAKEIKHLIETD